MRLTTCDKYSLVLFHTYISWFTSHFPHLESDGSWLHTADVSKRSGLVGLLPSVARLFYRPVQFHPRSSWVGQALWCGGIWWICTCWSSHCCVQHIHTSSGGSLSTCCLVVRCWTFHQFLLANFLIGFDVVHPTEHGSVVTYKPSCCIFGGCPSLTAM